MQANQAIRQQDGRSNGGTSDAINALLIEDNAADARFLQEILSDSNHIEFRLTHTETLKDGLERLAKTSFDVVLLDLNLPDSSGLASVDNLLAAYARAPVVVMTGNEEEDLGLRAVAAGAQDLLIKGHLDPTIAVRTIRFAVERFNALVRQQYETVRATGEKLQDEIGRIASSLDDAGQSTSSYRSGIFARDQAHRGIEVLNLKGGILAWILEGGQVNDAQGNPTRRVHVYGDKWDFAPSGWESVKFSFWEQMF